MISVTEKASVPTANKHVGEDHGLASSRMEDGEGHDFERAWG